MDNNDAIKETISNLKSVRNNFWTAILLTTGASITLALNAKKHNRIFIERNWSYISSNFYKSL